MTVLTLQSGANARDAALSNTSPAFNYGATTRLLGPSSRAKALLYVDLSSIPAGAACQSAVLTLYHSVIGASGAFTVTVYAIAAANAAWVQGAGDNVLALAGEPCWAARQADGAGGVSAAWAGSAGLSTSGVDYEAGALGSVNGNAADALAVAYAISLTPARVQAMFGPVNTNYGFLLIASANTGGCGSSEHPTPSYRWSFVTTYIVAGGLKVFTAPFAGPFG